MFNLYLNRKLNIKQQLEQQVDQQLQTMLKMSLIIQRENMERLNWFNHKIIMEIEFLLKYLSWVTLMHAIQMQQFGSEAVCIHHVAKANNAFWYCARKVRPYNVLSMWMTLFQSKWWNFREGKQTSHYMRLSINAIENLLFLYFFVIFSINKESIIDLNAKIVVVTSKIESCTEQNLELNVLEIYLISSAKPQLPLQIEDASRPEKNDVRSSL